MIYSFSLILESVCVLPQLLLLRQTTVPTVIDSYYLLTLGSYRAFYILNWIVRGAVEHHFDPIATIFGAVQTAFYVDFAWVYWTRQRVKLRGGGVVDSDDLRKGWLVNKVISGGRQSAELDEESLAADSASAGNGEARKPGRWGARGVSVSADDTLAEHDHRNKSKAGAQVPSGSTAETSVMLREDDDDELFSDGDGDAKPVGHEQAVLNSDEQWGSGSTSRQT